MPLFRKMLTVVRDSVKLVVHIGRGIMFRRNVLNTGAGTSLIELKRSDASSDTTDEEDINRMANGHRLFGVSSNNQIISFGWVAPPGCTVFLLFDNEFTVPVNFVYIWDCFTSPEQRNHGYFKLLLEQIPRKVSGINTALVAVDVSNTPSRAALKSAGYEKWFSYMSVRLFGKTCISLAYHRGSLSKLRTILDDLSQVD